MRHLKPRAIAKHEIDDILDAMICCKSKTRSISYQSTGQTYTTKFRGFRRHKLPCSFVQKPRTVDRYEKLWLGVVLLIGTEEGCADGCIIIIKQNSLEYCKMIQYNLISPRKDSRPQN